MAKSNKFKKMLGVGGLLAPEALTVIVGSMEPGNAIGSAIEHMMLTFGMVLPEGAVVTDEGVQTLFLGDTEFKIKHIPGTPADSLLLSNCHVSIRANSPKNYVALRDWFKTQSFLENDSDTNEQRSYVRLTHKTHFYSVHIAFRENPPVNPFKTREAKKRRTSRKEADYRGDTSAS